MVSFTVAICSHNRAASLQRALASLQAALRPDVQWNALVILNACGDESDAVVGRAAASLPVRAVAEPRVGLSNARNRAVTEIASDYVVFIDDDAIVHPNFLVAYAAAFRRWPDADIFGGVIRPTFEGTPPDWLLRALPAVGSAYAARTVDDNGGPITPARLPFGTNYAMRMSVQRAHSYDPALGRGRTGWIRNGEESEAILAALATGATGRWIAGAIVDHVVPADRQTVEYLWRYYEGYGRLRGLQGHRRRALSARVAASYLAYRWARLTAPPEGWAKALVRAAARRGEWKARADLMSGRAPPIAAAAMSR
jgi:glycosyltransferase involved in cell wall biosynthesis